MYPDPKQDMATEGHTNGRLSPHQQAAEVSGLTNKQSAQQASQRPERLHHTCGVECRLRVQDKGVKVEDDVCQQT